MVIKTQPPYKRSILAMIFCLNVPKPFRKAAYLQENSQQNIRSIETQNKLSLCLISPTIIC